jgi:hypothetical protein
MEMKWIAVAIRCLVGRLELAMKCINWAGIGNPIDDE